MEQSDLLTSRDELLFTNIINTPLPHDIIVSHIQVLDKLICLHTKYYNITHCSNTYKRHEVEKFLKPLCCILGYTDYTITLFRH